MRAKIVIPTLILFSISLFLCFFLKKHKEVNGLPLLTQSVHTNAGISNMATPVKTIAEAQNTQSPPARLTVADLTDPTKTNEILQYIESRNAPISFFGKVVDQDGNPLPEARIQGQVIHVIVALPADGGGQDQIIPVETKTDANGSFQVRGMTGRGFGIASILKDGYEVENLRSGWTTSPGSIENPVIFKMWSTNIHEQLIVGKKSFEIVPDGKPYFIDLSKGEISQTEGGDLKVWVKRPEPITSRRYDWSCEMDVLNGGLEPSDSNSMFLAPAEGYAQTVFQFEQKIGSGWGDTTGPKKFYAKLRNGQIYGKISIEILAHYNNQIPAMIRLSYTINPSGSRILR
jgi:hypothetical protein